MVSRPIRTLLLVSTLMLGAPALVGCASGPAVPPSGTTVDSSFWKSFLPPFKKGQQWTYVVTTVSGSTTATASQNVSVTDVTGDTATITTTTNGMAFPGASGNSTTTTSTASVSNPAAQFSSNASASIVSQGPDNVTAGGKTYNGAAKLSLTTSGNADFTTTAWIAPQVGLVKVVSNSSASGMSFSTTQELTRFTSP